MNCCQGQQKRQVSALNAGEREGGGERGGERGRGREGEREREREERGKCSMIWSMYISNILHFVLIPNLCVLYYPITIAAA